MQQYQTPSRKFLWNGKSWTLELDQACWCMLETISGLAYLDFVERFIGLRRGRLTMLQIFLFALTAKHQWTNRLVYTLTDMEKAQGVIVPFSFLSELPQDARQIPGLRRAVMEMLAEADLITITTTQAAEAVQGEQKAEPQGEQKAEPEEQQPDPLEASASPDPSSTGTGDSQTELS